MRVIFMGTPDFAVGTLEAILAAGHEVVLAVVSLQHLSLMHMRGCGRRV